MGLKGMSFCDWGVQAIGNTKPDVWPAEPIDPTQPFKWQTRRVIKSQPTRKGWDAEVGDTIIWHGKVCRLEESTGRNKAAMGELYPREIRAPYQPGDIVYVKEGLKRQGNVTLYANDDFPVIVGVNGDRLVYVPWRWKPRALSGRFMPRACARYWGRVREVRPERLRDISAEDCWAEGIDKGDGLVNIVIALNLFAGEWNALHKRDGHGWDANPWVWRYVFERVNRQEAERE